MGMSRIRLIYILKILSEETDEETGITLHQIKNRLCQQNIDRVWDDQRIRDDLSLIEELCEEGEIPFHMEKVTGAHNEYSYRFYRPGFGLNEARLVFDSVATSSFLSDGQKRDLLSQMEGFLSKREVISLKQRVQSRPSLMSNEKLLERMKVLYAAIENHRCLRFDYYKYGVDGKKHLDKHYCRIRPIQVMWGEGHYYLLAVNPEHGQKRRYRIDRMKHISEDNSTWFPVDSSEIGYGQFEMFGSIKKQMVTFRVYQSLMDMALEKLGTDVICRPDSEDGWARVSAEVEISDGFYRWVLKQAGKLEVIHPEEVRQKVKTKLTDMLENYR